MSNFKNHLSASKYLLSKFSLNEIANRWNGSGKGKHAKLATVKRWMNNGPKTKNPRFEPFIKQWAEAEYAKEVREQINIEVLATSINILRNAVINDLFAHPKLRATAASLITFVEYYPWPSPRQWELMQSLCRKV